MQIYLPKAKTNRLTRNFFHIKIQDRTKNNQSHSTPQQEGDKRLKPKSRKFLPKLRFPIVLLVIFLAGIPLIVHRFLSPTKTIKARVLIVEGWLPLYALQAAKEIFETDSYDLLITTGGPMSNSRYQNLSEYAAAVFSTMGINPRQIVSIPAPGVDIDRTWTSAVAVRNWLEQHHRKEASFNLVSLGPHTRRSWLTYQKIFGNQRRVGVISIPAIYHAQKWWITRRGYRLLAKEFISYLGFKILH